MRIDPDDVQATVLDLEAASAPAPRNEPAAEPPPSTEQKLALIRAYIGNVAAVASDPDLGEAAPPYFLETPSSDEEYGTNDIYTESMVHVSREDDGTVSSYHTEAGMPVECKLMSTDVDLEDGDPQQLAQLASHQLLVIGANTAWDLSTALRDVLLVAEAADTQLKALREQRSDPTLDDQDRLVSEAAAGELSKVHIGLMAALEPLAKVMPMPFFGDPPHAG